MSTINTWNDYDAGTEVKTVIDNNFSNLNADKLESVDLSSTPSPAKVTVNNTGGLDADIDLADGLNAGLISPSEKSEIAANTAKVTNATHTGDVTGDEALTITNDAVTNAKLDTMPTNSLKANATGGAANPTDLVLGNSTFAGRTSSSNIKGLSVSEAKTELGAGVAGGLATLDGSGKVPASQLTVSAMEYKGAWNASTNSPTLADGVGTTGDVYKVNVAGTQNLGSGSQTFALGDWVIYDGAIWDKSINSDAVDSVFGRVGAVVSANGDYTASQVTNVPSGTISSTTAQAAIDELESEKLANTDSKIPTQDENNALVGTNGAPSTSNKYVTNTDPRNTDSRTCDNTFDNAATSKTNLALVKADVGLGNVDNTSDASKPISTATQTALNLKPNATDTLSRKTTVITDFNSAGAKLTGFYDVGNTVLNRPLDFPAGSNFNTLYVTKYSTNNGRQELKTADRDSVVDFDLTWSRVWEGVTWTDWIGGETAAFIRTAAAQSNVTGDGTAYTVQFTGLEVDNRSNTTSTTFTADRAGVYRFNLALYLSGITVQGPLLIYLITTTKNRLMGYEALPSHSSKIYNKTIDAAMNNGDTASIQLQVVGASKTIDIQGFTGATQWSGSFVG